jgi:type IX secretion system PorP/SprF family membrane protein
LLKCSIWLIFEIVTEIMRRLTMRNYKLWIGAAFMLFASNVRAQQDPNFTHFAYNRLLFNPAYAGASGNFCLNAINHQQWVGYEDQTSILKTKRGTPIDENFSNNIAPQTTGIGFTAPITLNIKGEKINIGGLYGAFMQDNIAYEENTYMRGGFAGAYTLPDGSDIRLGFEVTSLTKALDGSKLRYHDPNDPFIPNARVADTRITFGAGAYYQNPNIMDGAWAGLSLSHLVPQTFQYGSGGNIKVTTARHLYLMGGYKQENFLGNGALTLEPAFMLKSAMGENGGFIKPELDLQGMVTWNSLYAGGVNLRAYGLGIDALSLMLGYYVPLPSGAMAERSNLRVGYSYDITLSNVYRTSFGTHEIQVNYCFNFELPDRPPKIYRHPRYMIRDPKSD